MYFDDILITIWGGIVTANGIQEDVDKMQTIMNWLLPKSIHDVRSFYGLALFYKRFIKNFSTIIEPMTEVIEGTSFQWNYKA